MDKLISTKWLYNKIQNDKEFCENLVLLDCSLSQTAEGGKSKYIDLSIEGARFFDLKSKFSDLSSPFPNMLVSQEHFETECQNIGINTTSKIVVFDNMGVYSSPRVWWMFKVMGHKDISVLDGGLQSWEKEGYPIKKRLPLKFKLGNFKANINNKYIVDYLDILRNTKTNAFTIIDARSSGRFNGTENEPRKHLKSGHIPNSINIPFEDVLDNGKFKSKKDLQTLFQSKSEGERTIVFSCGSGLTACIVMLACEISYKKGLLLYDGSWSEWAELQELKLT